MIKLVSKPIKELGRIFIHDTIDYQLKRLYTSNTGLFIEADKIYTLESVCDIDSQYIRVKENNHPHWNSKIFYSQKESHDIIFNNKLDVIIE